MAFAQRVQQGGVYARAVVAHRQAAHTAGAGHADFHRPAAAVAQRVFHQVAQRNGQAVHVAQGHRGAAVLGRQQVQAVDGARVLPELLDHGGGQLHQVHGFARQGRAGLGTRELQQFFGALGQRVQRGQRRFHLAALQAVVQRGLQAQAGGGQRGAQLVRGVGGQGALHVQRQRQALEQAVDMVFHRLQFARQAGQGDRVQQPAIAQRHFLRQRAQHPQLAARNAPQQQRQQGQHGAQRHDQPEQGAVHGRLALRQRVGHLQQQRARGVVQGVNAPAAGIGKTGRQRHVKQRGRRAGRARQHARRVVDDLERHGRFGKRGGRGDQQRGSSRGTVCRCAAAARLRGRAVEVVQRNVEHAVRHLHQFAVEVVVDFAADVPHHAQHAGQPYAAHPDDQAARQPACQGVHPERLRARRCHAVPGAPGAPGTGAGAGCSSR